MSNISGIAIVGTGSYVPENLLSNAELAQRFDVSEAWIEHKTGIQQRFVIDKDESTGSIGTEASKRALENANVSAEDVDLVICATSTADWTQPATAAAIHGNVGMRETSGSLDLNAVCSGFVYALHTGAALLAAETNWNHILVVGSDCYSRVVDPSDRSTAVLFGDGAGAVVLARTERDAGFLGSAFGTRFDLHTSLIVPQTEQYLHMEGRIVRDFAASHFGPAIEAACSEAGIASTELDVIIPHQSNRRIIEQALEALGIDEDKVVITVDQYGNTAAASIPMALAAARANDRPKPGDLVCFVGYGGGLTWAATVVRY